MLYRLCLAGMHYNENADRQQAENQSGDPIFVIRFPKYKKGDYSVKSKKVDPTFSEYNLVEIFFSNNRTGLNNNIDNFNMTNWSNKCSNCLVGKLIAIIPVLVT